MADGIFFMIAWLVLCGHVLFRPLRFFEFVFDISRPIFTPSSFVESRLAVWVRKSSRQRSPEWECCSAAHSRSTPVASWLLRWAYGRFSASAECSLWRAVHAAFQVSQQARTLFAHEEAKDSAQ
jgi:hypothetical protein